MNTFNRERLFSLVHTIMHIHAFIAHNDRELSSFQKYKFSTQEITNMNVEDFKISSQGSPQRNIQDGKDQNMLHMKIFDKILEK